MVLSYTGKVLSGSVPYSLPPMPFVPGTNAIARVIAAGDDVTHVRSGDRVFLSPHLRGDVPDREPPQILIGLTATVTHAGRARAAGALARRRVRRDRALAGGLRHAAGRTRRQARDRADRPGQADRAVRRPAAQRACAAATPSSSTARPAISAPARSCWRSRWAPAASSRSDASRRRWKSLREAFGPRVIPAVVSGEAAKDLAIIRHAAGGGADVALDLLGSAKSTSTTLSSPARAQARRPPGADGQRRGAAGDLVPRNAGE